MDMRVILLVALSSFLFVGIARCDNPILDGSSIKTEDIITKCDVIFVGKITSAGVPDISADHSSLGPEIHGIKVEVLQILRGVITDDWASISLNIYLISSKNETTPKAGDTYIFFVRKEDDTILKLLPDTDDTIATVKKLISN